MNTTQTTLVLYLQNKEQIKKLQQENFIIEKEFKTPPPKEQLRNIQFEDLDMGNILWCDDGDDGWFWVLVNDLYSKNLIKNLTTPNGWVVSDEVTGCDYRVDDKHWWVEK